MRLSATLLFGLCLSGFSTASELIYQPVNPSFGGNALNGSYLLNSANAQNDLKDPDLDDETGLDDFNDSLQRALLSRLTSTLTGSMVDADGNLVPGILETGDYIIEITDIGDGELRVTTTERATGESTTFIVDSI
ncbi:MAG: curli assembly protein CsgF [Ketobacteraceae bacterium]|nr:curli assembly protein CsgF [Ketobacteraceae bacterium]